MRYRNGEFDGGATNSEFSLWFQLQESKKAIQAITPWLSASLGNDSCDEYKKACDLCFLEGM